MTKISLATITLAVAFAGAANAKCRVTLTPRPGAANRELLSLPTHSDIKPHAAEANDPPADPSIAGYWYVQFVSGGQLVDDGFDIWHADGTEVLNDTSAPSSGNVCLGVWAKTGPSTYTLKHPTWIFDDAGVNLIGIAVIREQITMHGDGNNYSGTSTFDQYDLNGNLVFHATSLVIGKRITAVDDPGHTTGIPGLPTSILNR